MWSSLLSAAHLPDTALLDLQARHFAVVPSFLTPNATVRAAVLGVVADAKAGKFEEAGVGSGDSNRLAVEQRRCSTCHLYPDEAAAELCGAGDDVARQQLYDAIDSIRDSLSDFDDRPLVKTEGLYLDYPLGGFFKRHIDAAPGLGLDQEWRRYSYLLYLNDVQRGGELRLYTDESDALSRSSRVRGPWSSSGRTSSSTRRWRRGSRALPARAGSHDARAAGARRSRVD